MDQRHYIIRGGVEGRDRLRVLSGVMWPTTLALFERVGVRAGMTCLDIGCGSGDVTLALAHLVGPDGSVDGTDLDATKITLAQQDADSAGIGNVRFHCVDLLAAETAGYNLAYARFVLSHLPDPADALTRISAALRPGGILVVEDVDFTGHFCYPPSPAFARYVTLYTETAKRRGVDPDIGPRLPVLLTEAGFEEVGFTVVQPAAMQGDVKLMNPLTLENIAPSVVAAGLATQGEMDQLVQDLYAFAHDPHTVMSIPRIVQAWGRRTMA